MKFLIPLLCLLIVQGAYAAEDPADLTTLRNSWENSQAKAIEKNNKIYLKELEKLKKKYMGAKNLDAAVAVDGEIKEVMTMELQERLNAPINGVWNALYSNGATRTYLIKGNNITVEKSSFGGVGQKVKLKKYLHGWLAEYPVNKRAEYVFFIDDKIYIHHWRPNMNYKTRIPVYVAIGTKE